MTIPDSWAKVSFSQFMRIQPTMKVTEILSVLLEQAEEYVLTMDLDLEKAFQTLQFLNEPIPQTASTLNLEVLSLAQYEDMRSYVKQMKGTADDFQHYPVIFATYYQKPYDADTVDALIPEVERMPAGIVLGHVQHYMKEMNRIEEKWNGLFPKEGYTADQQAAGFPQLAEFFGLYGSLIFAERNSKWTRDEWLEKSVADFKLFMLYLAREGESQKKYSEGKVLRAKTTKKR